MKSGQTGIVTSGVEVVQLTPYGVWLDLEGTEYFLAHDEFPWFREAPIHAVWKVELDQSGNLHWPELDVDLERASIENLEAFPLTYR
jgi:hypothetical protein